MDEFIRNLERKALGGDPEAEKRLEHHRRYLRHPTVVLFLRGRFNNDDGEMCTDQFPDPAGPEASTPSQLAALF
jgi:hypothetical protein